MRNKVHSEANAIEHTTREIDKYKRAICLVNLATIAKAKAAEKKDFRLYLDIDRKLQVKLRNLGIVSQEPAETEPARVVDWRELLADTISSVAL